MRRMIGSMLIVLSAAAAVLATPSTQIWNPSTDVKTTGVYHLDVDNYFTVNDVSSGGYSFPTDLGLLYGLLPGLEVGVDSSTPQANLSTSSLLFNAKYGIAENGALPALAIGGFNFGNHAADPNILYALAAKTFNFGRLSAGYFSGRESVLGSGQNSGPMLTWDKSITDKLWLCIDYAGSNSTYGSTFYGGSWKFASNVSVLFAYGTWNNGAKPVITTQLDIDI